MPTKRKLLAATALALLLGCGASEEAASPDASDSAADASTDSGSQAAVDAGGQDAATDAGREPTDSGAVDEDGSALPSDAGMPEADAGPPLEDDIPDGPNVVKMVAPSACMAANQRLFGCRFGPLDLTPTSVPTEGRFKTRVSGHRKGDCSTQFPFIAEVSADGIAPFRFDLVTNGEIFLRRDDDAALTSLHVEEGSNFAGRESYDDSCRVWLEVEFNVALPPLP